MPRKYTEARKENNRKWDAENLDRMSLALPKGQKERIQAAASASGEKSVNAWISKAIEARLAGAQAQQPDGLTAKAITLDLSKSDGLTMDQLEHAAEQCGQSVNEWVLEAIRDRI